MESYKTNQTDKRPLKLFFEDEAKFGRINQVKKCWVYHSDRAIVQQQQIREYIYAFTTVCPQSGETFSMISPFCNTDAMNLFLKETAIYYNQYRIIMVMDSAGWHTTKKLELTDNIVILTLPPYSPQLNPVEHIWDYIREQKKFNNYTFHSLDEVEDQLAKALSDLHNEKAAIKSLCNFNSITYTSC